MKLARAKCVSLCSNCHLKVHGELRKKGEL